MSYTVIKKLPPIETLLQEIPLEDEGYEKISRDRREIKKIISGEDSRMLMIIGPCSAWPSQAVLEYAKKLQRLNLELSDVLKIVMRVYIQKPRTTKGWTGPVNQPNPLSGPDIETGIRYVRQLMVQIVSMGLPIADEALFTHNAKGFMELLSWVAIGARSAEDQEHRIFASSIDCAVGLKNPTHGSLAIGVNGIIAAQHSHVAVFDGHEVQTHGNAHAHLVLRGGNGSPNYGLHYLEEVASLMTANRINNPALMIDASHDNCLFDGKKDHRRQSEVISKVLDSVESRPDLKKLIKGFMVESFIKDGNQQVDLNRPETIDRTGLSITDPCLDWEASEKLLRNLAERLRK
jgi:3-deoxy-7-phosphoheptulonate synthase